MATLISNIADPQGDAVTSAYVNNIASPLTWMPSCKGIGLKYLLQKLKVSKCMPHIAIGSTMMDTDTQHIYIIGPNEELFRLS